MSTLTFHDRLTLKRNILLQKQLQVRLQIMGEEYRMTRNNLERHTRDVSDFLVYIRHTVPDLNNYSQPDTRSMKDSGMAMKRRFRGEKLSGLGDIFCYEHQGREASMRRKYECVDEKTGTRESSENERKDEDEFKSHPSASSSSHTFFNQDIFDDKNINSRLQQMTIRKKSYPVGPYENSEDHSLKHRVASNKRDAPEGIGHHGKYTPVLESHSPQSQKYGRDACTKQDEVFRKKLLRRFEAIFSDNDTKLEDIIYHKQIMAASARLPKNMDPVEAITQSQTSLLNHKQTISNTPTIASSSNILKRRLTWSAPHRKRQHGKRTLKKTTFSKQQLQGGSLQNECLISCPETAERTFQQRSLSVMPKTYTDELNAELRSTTGQHQTQVRRPKTAPPNYELKQKGLPASRQQVAGLLADVQSRKADTRAILKRSRQLQDRMKILAPRELSDDSLSD